MRQLSVFGGVYFSYQTMLRQTVNGVTFGNVTDYSQFSNGATRRHQKLARVHSCDIQLDNVPLGTSDLYTIACERGQYRPKCNQCDSRVINGVYSHERGCPNRHSRYDGQQWIKQVECRECGSLVDVGDSCDCMSLDWEQD